MAENIENKNLDNGADESNQQQQTKTYTEEEVLALIQSEADKRVSQALKTQQKKYEKQLSLSGLDEAERTKKEKDLRIQELEEQIKEFNLIKNKNEIVKVLTARKLNPAFAELISIGDDLEQAQANIETLDKLIKQAVQDEVKTRLNGGTPKKGSADNEEITPEKFKKMTLAQKSQLYNTNPDLFNKLSGN